MYTLATGETLLATGKRGNYTYYTHIPRAADHHSVEKPKLHHNLY
jgi:hypothetical protein